MKKFIGLIIILPLFLTACSGVQSQQPDPSVVARIVSACTQSGLFQAVDGMLSAAVPIATIPIMLINAGVDQVCGNPSRFASDISTVEWVIKNISNVLQKR